jgi:hypothetical protein
MGFVVKTEKRKGEKRKGRDLRDSVPPRFVLVTTFRFAEANQAASGQLQDMNSSQMSGCGAGEGIGPGWSTKGLLQRAAM